MKKLSKPWMEDPVTNCGNWFPYLFPNLREGERKRGKRGTATKDLAAWSALNFPIYQLYNMPIYFSYICHMNMPPSNPITHASEQYWLPPLLTGKSALVESAWLGDIIYITSFIPFHALFFPYITNNTYNKSLAYEISCAQLLVMITNIYISWSLNMKLITKSIYPELPMCSGYKKRSIIKFKLYNLLAPAHEPA